MALDLRAHPGAGYRQRDRYCHLHVAALCGPELLDHGQDAASGPAGVSDAQPEPAGQPGPLPLDCGHRWGLSYSTPSIASADWVTVALLVLVMIRLLW